jgi:hypothetical protein
MALFEGVISDFHDPLNRSVLQKTSKSINRQFYLIKSTFSPNAIPRIFGISSTG